MAYGQRMGSQEYMNIFNRLGALAGYGAVGVQAGTQAGAMYGQQGVNIAGDYGYNRMSSYVGQANAGAGMWTDVGRAIGAYGPEFYDWWQKRNSSSSPPGASDGFNPPDGYYGVGT
jgi:hypothetical protein